MGLKAYLCRKARPHRKAWKHRHSAFKVRWNRAALGSGHPEMVVEKRPQQCQILGVHTSVWAVFALATFVLIRPEGPPLFLCSKHAEAYKKDPNLKTFIEEHPNAS